MKQNLPSKQSLSLVVPCYNEAAALDWFLDQLQELISDPRFPIRFSQFETLIIDDGSDEAMNWPNELPDYIRVVRLPTRSGYGAALKTGVSLSQGQLVGFFDLDGSYSPGDLFDLLHELEHSNVSVVYGNRLHRFSEMPWLRRLGNSFYSLLCKVFLGGSITDVCTGWRLFKSDIKGLCLSVPENGLNFSLALTTKLPLMKVPQSETVISYRERKGRSKLIITKDGFLFLLPLVKAWYAQLANHRFRAGRRA